MKDKLKKIDIFIPTLEIGGAERSASLLYKSLKKNYKNTRLITSDVPLNKTLNDDYISIPRNYFLKRFNKLINIRKVVRENNTDMVIVFLNHTSILVFISLLFMKIKFVICERSDPFNSGRNFILGLVTRVVYKLSSQVIVQTERLKEEMKKQWGLTNISVIPNIAPSVDKKSKLNNIRKKVKNIVTISRIVKTKNCDILLETLAPILNDDLKLTIYGYGPEEKAIKLLIKTLNIEDKVNIISDNFILNQMFYDADMFISLSSLEGFPNSLLEAVSFGIPSMAYDCNYGPSEILGSGQYGVLLKSLDKAYIENNIRHFIEDYDGRKKYSIAGLSFVEKNFTSESILKLWLSVIKAA